MINTISKDTLITIDAKQKLRVVEVSYFWSDAIHGFIIERQTYQLGGKITSQPDICVLKGKANRTVTEQVKLEFSSHLKKYMDKGYKLLNMGESLEDPNVIQYYKELFKNGITDTNGFKKHMLAKDEKKITTGILDKIAYWYASRKIDGVRCSFFWDGSKIKSASRGGKDYDASTVHIRNHPKLVEFLKNHPNIILDGELYLHGKSLQQISGAARQEKKGSSSKWLEYYIYDVMEDNKSFEERLGTLDFIEEGLELKPFNPNYSFEEGELQIQMVPQEKVVGWTNIKKLHDQYVSEGFEGVVVRDPSKNYNFGGRTNSMIKIKEYQDAEFKIIGFSEGLRPEDMVFVCVTETGLEFEAKPVGPRELKYEYLENMNEIIGKMATIKFFNYSDTGKPTQPTLKCIRDYE